MSLTLARAGYALLAQNGQVAIGQAKYGDILDTETVIELGSVERTLGALAATVYACALLAGSTSFATELWRMGPWSWSPEAWVSSEAYELLHDDAHALRDTQMLLNEYTFGEESD